MTAPGDDDPSADATAASTTYTVTVSGKAERLLRTVADAWELERPTSLGPLGQLPDIASEAFARGLVELAAESGLDVDRARLLPTDESWRAARESAAIAREASLLFRRDHRGAMSRLAEAFPTLRESVPGVRPWDPEAIDTWLDTSGAVTSGSRDAAAFVLGVWNPNAQGRVAFDVHRALGTWDRAHRAAFLAWATAPWWP